MASQVAVDPFAEPGQRAFCSQRIRDDQIGRPLAYLRTARYRAVNLYWAAPSAGAVSVAAPSAGAVSVAAPSAGAVVAALSVVEGAAGVDGSEAVSLQPITPTVKQSPKKTTAMRLMCETSCI